MRILFITWNYPPKVGGMEMMLSELVNGLRRYAEVCVIAPATGGREPVVSEDELVIRGSRPGLLGFMIDALRLGKNNLQADDFDLVIAGSALVAPIVFVLGRLFGKPIVVNVYGLDIIYPHPLYQWMVGAFLPRFDRVIAISEAAKKLAMDRAVTSDRITIIPPGINFAEFSEVPDIEELRRELDFQDRMILLSAGRLAKRKGVLEFVQYVLPDIVAQYPNVLYVIAGGNPTDSLSHKADIQARIVEEVHNLGLEKHVRLLGRVEREYLVQLFHACDLFVLPAIRVEGDVEGFGIVLVEASAAGKPVVSTKLGGIPDAVLEGRSGVLVEPEDWETLIAVITTLLSDEMARRDMGRFGRRRARLELDWTIIAQRYAEYLRDITSIKRSVL